MLSITRSLKFCHLIKTSFFLSPAMVDAAAIKSLPDLAFAASHSGSEGKTTQIGETGQMPAEGQKKAKNRFLSFLGKKDKKVKVVSGIDMCF